MSGVVVGTGRASIPDAAASADAELEWAADLWRVNPPIRRAVALDDWLAAPHALLLAHLTPAPGWDADDPPHRLLPAQRAVAHRVMLSERRYGPVIAPRRQPAAAEEAAALHALPPDATRRGDRYVEPLRHHCHRMAYHSEGRRR